MFFSKKVREKAQTSLKGGDFSYLDPQAIYLDSACQTLRPQRVIDAEERYYYEFNACADRAKHEWGDRVTTTVHQTRKKLLEMVQRKSDEFTVFFTLNTTSAIQQVMHQLAPEKFQRIFVSEIEHNSVFLPSITVAKRNGWERKVLSRFQDGGLNMDGVEMDKAVLLVNSFSNIDGRQCVNLPLVAKDIRERGGLVLIDGAQHFGDDLSLIQETDFDVVFSSGHKMYGPSMGFGIVRKSLLKDMEIYLIGGGMVQDVHHDSYDLIGESDLAHTRLEMGLQNYAGISGLHEAIDWLDKQTNDRALEQKHALAQKLYQGLLEIPGLKMFNTQPSTVISFSHERYDGHQLASFLSEQKVMCRSGYFCCHYYLKNLLKVPPLLRASLGYNNTEEQIETFLGYLRRILS